MPQIFAHPNLHEQRDYILPSAQPRIHELPESLVSLFRTELFESGLDSSDAEYTLECVGNRFQLRRHGQLVNPRFAPIAESLLVRIANASKPMGARRTSQQRDFNHTATVGSVEGVDEIPTSELKYFVLSNQLSTFDAAKLILARLMHARTSDVRVLHAQVVEATNPYDVLDAAIQGYSADKDESWFMHASALLEEFPSDSWLAVLEKLVEPDLFETIFFIQTITRSPKIEQHERQELLRKVARTKHAEVLEELLDEAESLNKEDKILVLNEIAQFGLDSARDRARYELGLASES